MVDKRVRTVVEVGVDDREIRGLDRTLERAFDEKQVRAFEDAIDRTTRSLGKLAEVLAKVDQGLGKVEGGGAGGGRGAPTGRGGGGGPRDSSGRFTGQGGAQGGGQPGFANRALSSAAGVWLGHKLMGAGQRLKGAASTIPQGQGFVGSMVGGLPGVGSFLEGGLQGIQQFYSEYAAADSARAQAAGRTGTALKAGGGRGMELAKLGIDRASTPGVLAGLAQQSGLTGDALTPEFAMQALELQKYGGVQNPGGIVSAAGAAGGRVQDPAKLMTEAVGSGLAAGMREAKLDQYLQQISGTLEEARSSGFRIAPESMMGMVRGFGSLGGTFQGERAARAATGMTKGLQGAGRKGGLANMLALRAAGMGKSTDYMGALKKLQTEPTSVVPKLIKDLKSAGGGRKGTQLLLMEVLGNLGVNLSVEDTERMIDEEFRTGGGGEGEEFLRKREGRVSGAFSTAKIEAEHRNKRVDTGSKVATAAREIRSFELGLAKDVLPMVAEGVEEVVGYLKGLYETFQNEGVSGVIGKIFGDVSGMFKEFAAQAQNAFNEVADKVIKWLNENFGSDIVRPDLDRMDRKGREVYGAEPTEDEKRIYRNAKKQMESGIPIGSEKTTIDGTPIREWLKNKAEQMGDDPSIFNKKEDAGGEDGPQAAAFYLRKSADILERTGELPEGMAGRFA